MKAVYIDIHIHTSENPNDINSDYNVEKLIERVGDMSQGNPTLLSLTDHNTINKSAYLKLKDVAENIIIGAELHIKKYDEAPPYHCHILFNVPVEEKVLDSLNAILDELYPNKVVTDGDKNVPNIEQIANKFDAYEFVLLPHGGQSHRTFDKATAKGHRFDTSLEQSLYFNHFEGFTARSNKGLTGTQAYFERMGINQFVNLVTCTDNYNPEIYPAAKSKDAEEFIPTWIFSEPTFEGLRLALSESSRIVYATQVPETWNKTIHSVTLSEKNCDIDVNLTPGLNVVIGGSSSGKTLFVDSLVNSIRGDLSDSRYTNYNVDNIVVDNPSNVTPHYINQNFIMSVFQNENLDLGDIDIIKEVFPQDEDVTVKIRQSLSQLRELIEELIDNVQKYEKGQKALTHIASPAYLIIGEKTPQNIPALLKPTTKDKNRFNLDSYDFEDYIGTLDQIKSVFMKSGLNIPYKEEIERLKQGLEEIFDISILNQLVLDSIDGCVDAEMTRVGDEKRAISQKLEQRQKLTENVKICIEALKNFDLIKKKLSEFNVTFNTKEICVCGHKLSIENTFKLTDEILTEAINACLKSENRISTFQDLQPNNLFKQGFSERPKVRDYKQFVNKVYDAVSENNKNEYRIITSKGMDFDSLSPGWKSATILDLILGYNEDSAPLIIDQPEDNLATDYINHGLIEQIKRIKPKKQIILVSHNATIPMLGDAQNIIVCKNEEGRIDIKSAPLESKIDDHRILDLVANITDGGKASVKKRVKKYDLKRYKE